MRGAWYIKRWRYNNNQATQPPPEWKCCCRWNFHARTKSESHRATIFIEATQRHIWRSRIGVRNRFIVSFRTMLYHINYSVILLVWTFRELVLINGMRPWNVNSWTTMAVWNIVYCLGRIFIPIAINAPLNIPNQTKSAESTELRIDQLSVYFKVKNHLFYSGNNCSKHFNTWSINILYFQVIKSYTHLTYKI